MKKNGKFLIFLVEDDSFYQSFIKDELINRSLAFRHKFDIKTFDIGELCLDSLELEPDIIILDYNLNSKYPEARDGKDILTGIKNHHNNTDVIILSGQKDVNIAVQMFERNVSDYIIKDKATIFKLVNTIKRVFDNKTEEKINSQFKKKRSFLFKLALTICITEALAIIYLLLK